MTIERASPYPPTYGDEPRNPAPRNLRLSGKWGVCLGLLIVALALLGGSSRPDPIQHVVLRPIAAVLLIPALYRLRAADLAGARAVLVLGGLLLGWMILQLVPLPPAIWQALSGRAVIAELDALAGLQGIWRPLSLAPFRGLNAVFGMVVPISALLLVLAMRSTTQSILVAIAGLGLVNATFAILQIIGGSESPFYLYALANRGGASGIFANENHAAVFASIALLAIARLAVTARSQDLAAWLKVSLAPAYFVVLLAVLPTGSRAGFATALLALGAGGLMIGMGWKAGGRARLQNDRPAQRDRRFGLPLFAAGAVGVMLVIVAFFYLDRVPSMRDIVDNDPLQDLRWKLWPVLLAMMREHWLFGTGFGSFDIVYRLYEPAELLMPRYVNQAHNDWAQLVIEGGLPAVVAVLGLIGWACEAVFRVVRKRGTGSAPIAVVWFASLAIIVAASTVDYPLRTPIFQALLVWMILCLIQDRRAIEVHPTQQKKG